MGSALIMEVISVMDDELLALALVAGKLLTKVKNLC